MPDDLRQRLARMTGKTPPAPPAVEAPEGPEEAPPVASDVSGVKERLRQLLATKGRALSPEVERSLEEKPRPAPPISRRRRQPLESVIEGTWEESRFGRVFVVERRWPLTEHHAGGPLGGLLELPGELVALLEKHPPEGFDFRRAVFLDTETTGLAGGTGTLPFLIGIGRFDGDEYLLRQFFIADPGAERGQLELLRLELESSTGIVTYNGRGFDWPLIRTRYLVNGLRPGFIQADPPHIDLLPWARRLWKPRLESCSLGFIEREVLGMERLDDIPGGEIPALYTSWLRGAPVEERLALVFWHNQNDIKSLASLADRALRLAADPLNCYDHPADLAACGKLPLLADSRAELLEAALAHPLSADLARSIRWQLSLHYKGCGDYDRARPLWTELRRGPYEPGPYEEEAKFLEHRAKDLPAALALIEEALTRCARTVTDPYRRSRQEEALLYRRTRLLGKVNGEGGSIAAVPQESAITEGAAD